jgi:ADP-heptose:LPS heptosyltransferase
LLLSVATDAQHTESRVRRVLIYRLGSLGDTVVALPVLHLIARAYPNAERRLLTNIPVHEKAPLAAAVLAPADGGPGPNLVHGYMRYPVGMRDVSGLLALRSEIRKFRPEVLVYLAASRGERAVRRDALFFRLCGIRKIIGLPTTHDLANCREVSQEAARARYPGLSVHPLIEPEASRLARTVAELGDAQLDSPESWDLQLTAAERERAAAMLSVAQGKPILAIAIGTKVQAKDWGAENWRALLDRLASEYPRHAVALVGAAQEAAMSSAAAQAWAGRSINLCGALSPRETAAALAHAQLFVGLDSGPMHLAATVGTPIVAIFAARNRPLQWFPAVTRVPHRIVYHQVDCWGCGLETCTVERKKCLTSITVEEVFAAVKDEMQRAEAAAQLR